MEKRLLRGIAVALALAVAGPALASVPATTTLAGVAPTLAAAASASPALPGERSAGRIELAGGGYHYGKPRHWRGRGYHRPYRHKYRGYWRHPHRGYWKRPVRRRAICTRRVVRWTHWGKVVKITRYPCRYRHRRW